MILKLINSGEEGGGDQCEANQFITVGGFSHLFV